MKKEILKYIQLYTGCTDHTLKRIELILDEKLKPVESAPKEVIYVEKFYRKGITPEKSLHEWCEIYYKENNTSLAEINVRCREKDQVRFRNRFFKEAFKAGYSASELGRLTGRSHATILHNIHDHKKNKSKKK